MSYTTQDRVEAYLGRQLTENEIVLLDELIESTSDYISVYCNRVWSSLDEDDDEDLEATVRYFDGNGRRELYVDDFINLEYVKADATFNQADDWALYPQNKNPKQSIRLKNGHFPLGVENVEISAIWGAGDPPKGVIQVCTALVGNHLTSVGEATFKKESIEGYSYELASVGVADDTLKKTLDIYKKYSL